MEIGFGELILIFTLALLLLGPKRLPAAARSWGRTINRLKRELSTFLNVDEK